MSPYFDCRLLESVRVLFIAKKDIFRQNTDTSPQSNYFQWFCLVGTYQAETETRIAAGFSLAECEMFSNAE